MSIRATIDGAVAATIASHPKLFTPKGLEKAQAILVRKIMAALSDRDKAPAPPDPPAPQTSPQRFMLVNQNSREAQAYTNLRRIAGGLKPRQMSDGRVIIPAPAFCSAVFALADLPPFCDWPFLTDANKVKAWMEFFREMLPDIPRRPITETRDGVTGICMPAYWPPSKTGKMYYDEISEAETL